MPQLTLPIVAGDLALTALVNVETQKAHELLTSGHGLPAGVWVGAVIDTGSSLTFVSRSVLRQLGLTPTGQGTSHTALGPMAADIYRMSLSLLVSQRSTTPMLTFNDMNVLALSTSLHGVDVLVGMDVLLACKLIVDGPAKQFTLEF